MWRDRLSTVSSIGWSIVDQVSQPVLERLTVPFQQPHDPGIFLELSRAETTKLSPEIEGFVLEIENASIGTYYDRLQLSKVWFQESNASTTQEAANSVPFVPHIDGSRYFKIMVYINDVGEADGPMWIAARSPAAMEPHRRQFEIGYKERGENVVADVDEATLTALRGSRGTAVLFDTNTPHTAGQAHPHGLRRIVRFDFACSAWENNVSAQPLHRRLMRAMRGRTPR